MNQVEDWSLFQVLLCCSIFFNRTYPTRNLFSILTVHFHWTFFSNHKVLTARKTTPAPVERSGTAVTAAPAKRQHATCHHSKVIPAPQTAAEAVSAKKVDTYGKQTHPVFHTLSFHQAHGRCRKCRFFVYFKFCDVWEDLRVVFLPMRQINILFVRWRKKRLGNGNAILVFGVSATTDKVVVMGARTALIPMFFTWWLATATEPKHSDHRQRAIGDFGVLDMKATENITKGISTI